MKSADHTDLQGTFATHRYWGIALCAVILLTLQCGIMLGQSDSTWQRIMQETDFEQRKSIILKDGVWLLYSNPDRLPELANLSAQLAAQHEDQELRVAAHTFRAMYLRNTGTLDSALFHYNAALELLRPGGPTLQLARNYNLISIAVRDLGDDESFLAYNDSAITAADAINDEQFKLLLRNNRASILLNLNKKDAALSIMRDLNRTLKQSKDFGMRSSTSLNLAYLFHEIDQPDSAAYYTQRAIDYAETAGENRQLASALSHLAKLEQDQPEEALAAVSKALELYRGLNDTRGILIASIQLARIQFESGNTQGATHTLDSVIVAARKARMMETLKMALNEAYLIHEQSGNYPAALKHHKELYAIGDSLNTAETNKHIAHLEAKYQYREQQRQLEILKRDRAIEQQRTLLLYGMIGGLSILSVVILLALIFRFKARQKLASKEKTNLQLELETKRLSEEKLNSELALKNKRLTTKALLLSERNELLGQLMKRLNAYPKLDQSGRDKIISDIRREVKLNLNDGAEWKEFRTYFEESNPKFLEQVEQLNVELTEKDKRLLALSRLGLNTKEIAHLMHIAPESVKMSRYRLKKKLNLGDEETIWDFVKRQ